MTTAPLLGRPVGASGDESRRRIITAAMQCVAEIGYSRTTMREIARLAGMTSGSIYHYFPNKTQLMVAAVTHMTDIARPRLIAAAASGHTTLEKLLAVFDECDELNVDYPHAAAFNRSFRIECAEHRDHPDAVPSLLTALRDIVTNIVDQARLEGALAQDINTDNAATAILTVFRGLSEYSTMAPDSDHQATVHALRALLAGTLFDYDKLN